MSLSANPLATLWSKAPTKPTPSSANVDNVVAARDLETAPKTPSNFSHQREVSPNDDQENRGAIVGMASAEVYVQMSQSSTQQVHLQCMRLMLHHAHKLS
jgi:hypothetical protein